MFYNLMTLSFSGSSKAIVASQKEGFPSRKRNRKAEAAAQSQAESIKKKGICHVPIRLAVLFSGEEIYLTASQQNPLWGFRPGQTQTRLHNHRRRLEA